MPKPYLIKRQSGVFVRFFVPSDIQPVLGSRYLVRRLPHPMGDDARLVAHQWAVALCQAFEAHRSKQMGNDELKAFASGLSALRSGNGRDYVFSRSADGAITIQADGVEDHRLALEMLRASESVTPPPPPARKTSPLLSEQIVKYVTDLKNAGLSEGNILDSRNTLQLFLGKV